MSKSRMLKIMFFLVWLLAIIFALICFFSREYLCTFFLVITLLSPVVLLKLNGLYKLTNHFQNQFIDIMKFRGKQAFELGIPHNLEVVNLGSNHPKFAFDYSDLSVKGMNWAVGPQTFEYDYMILKKFHSFLTIGATVIIPVCPLKFFLYKYKNLSAVTKYFGTFDTYIIPDYNPLLYKKKFQYPLLFNPKYARFILKDVRKDDRMELQVNPMSEQQIQRDAKMWIDDCWNREFDIDICHMQELSVENAQAIQANIRLLREIVVFCMTRNYHPVITYLPVSKALSEKFSSEFIEKHIHSYVNRAISGLDVLVWDYMKDERFQSSEYYINSFFMNRKGARYFTNLFLRELEQRRAGEVH